MKIDKEKFNKLKQLDRIEYRQKQDRIQAWQKTSWGVVFLIPATVFIFMLILLIPQGYNVWGIEFVNDLSEAIGTLVGFLIGLSIVGFFIDFLLMLVRMKNLTELEEEYFSVEVKK